jgi:hypothetical protein
MSRPARAAVARETQAIMAAGRYDRDGRAPRGAFAARLGPLTA